MYLYVFLEGFVALLATRTHSHDVKCSRKFLFCVVVDAYAKVSFTLVTHFAMWHLLREVAPAVLDCEGVGFVVLVGV